MRIDSSTICGTDLHILKGDVPETTPGTVLGHEAVGTVEEVGAERHHGRPSATACCCRASAPAGAAASARRAATASASAAAAGSSVTLIDGLQAEYARVPFADNSVYKVPDELSDEQVLFLADILPDVLRGRRAQRHGRARATSSRSSAPGRSGWRRS